MSLGARLLAVLAALTLLCAPSEVSARTLQLGASFDAVQADYPDAQLDPGDVDAHRVLQLRGIDHAGVRWSLVEFIFDVSNHLSAVRLHTTTASFASVQQLVMNQMQPPEAASLAADAPGGESMQIRLCENSKTGVTVTLERPALSA